MGDLNGLDFGSAAVPNSKQFDPTDILGGNIPPMAPTEKPTVLRIDKETEEEKLKHGAYLKYDAKIKKWIGIMQKNNIKVLICSLHDVLWSDAAWERVGMHEFMDDGQAKLKKLYRKAALLTHPDRNQTKGADQRFLANAILGALNEAWAEFEKNPNII